MNETTLLIEPHDPVIFRDGKPFTDGLPAKSLPFPLPATTAGAIRSRSAENLDFEDGKVLAGLLAIEQIGPFAAAWDETKKKWVVLLPAPADAAPYLVNSILEYARLCPEEAGPVGGSDLPTGLKPLFGARPKKLFEKAPGLWPADAMSEWLQSKGKGPSLAGGFAALPVQRRMHVSIDPDNLIAKDGMLFATDGLEFSWPAPDLEKDGNHLPARRAAIVSKVFSEGPLAVPEVAPLGGERRLAIWKKLSDADVEWPTPPATGSRDGKLIRVVLATPGMFTGGWRPGWCPVGGGVPPGVKDLRLELEAAAVPRFQPVSGWDLRKAPHGGPKATRFLAPAGSVYFFRVRGTGDPAQLWMRSICDGEQDQRDGYGIALTGDC